MAEQTGRLLAERVREWLKRLATDAVSFGAVELEVPEQAQRQADLYFAGSLAKAGEQPEMMYVIVFTASAVVVHRAWGEPAGSLLVVSLLTLLLGDFGHIRRSVKRFPMMRAVID